MLHLYKSNRLEWLADKLSESIHSAGNLHPLQSDTVIVPNRDNARWLQFKIAEKNVISANIQYLLPAEWMWNEIRRIYPKTPKELATDKNSLKWAVLNLLMNNMIPENATLVKNYISTSADANKAERHMQLSNLIASVFDKYLVHRPDMIIEWEEGRRVSENRHEMWQMKFWNRLTDQWQRIYDTKSQYHKPALWKEMLLKVQSDNVTKGLNQNLWVFHPGKLPEPLVDMIVAYSSHIRVHIFNHQLVDLKNTDYKSDNFFSDMLDEEIFAERSYQFHISEYNIKYDQKTHFEKRSESSFLHLMQDRLLKNYSNENGEPSLSPDQSVSIHSCHSKLREIETLHNYILNCIENSDSIYPDDIVVVSPDIDKYAPYVKAVFDTEDRDFPGIPFSIGEKSIIEKKSIFTILEKIFDFIDSRWYPSDFMDILHSGPIMEKFDLSETDVSTIRRWTADNHVTWGMDSDHRKKENQPENKTNTFRSSLNRLWFGSLFELPEFEMIDNIPAYNGIDTTEKEEVLARYSALINLLNKIRIETGTNRTMSEWSEHGVTWIDHLFPKNSEKTPMYDIVELVRSPHKHSSFCDFDEKVPYQIFKKEVLAAIKETRSTTASLSRGVVFSSMVPMRNIPFKIVAMIGINEEEFPRKTNTPEFDLIQNAPTTRETTVKDEDRYLFLQYVMAPSDNLYISYIGRSIVDNEKIQPSVILEKWMDRIEEICGVNMYNFISEEPLNGFSEDLYREKRSFSNTYADVAASLNKKNRRRGNYASLQESTEKTQKVISIKDLESFFKNPLKFFVIQNHNIRLSDFDDQLGKETFVPDALLSYKLTGPVIDWMESGKSKDSAKKILINSGIVPDDFLGHKTTNLIIEQSKDILNLIYEETGSLKKARINISNTLNNNNIEGYIESYSIDKYYDIFLSSKSGKTLIVAWLRYLLLLNHHKKSFIENRVLLNAKKDGGEWLSFSPVENPDEVLENLTEIYRRGVEAPFLFAPKTSYLFSKIQYEKNFEKAIQRAESEWFGNFVIAENSDPVYQLWFGRSNPVELPEFQKNSDRVFKDLIKNLE